MCVYTQLRDLVLYKRNLYNYIYCTTRRRLWTITSIDERVSLSRVRVLGINWKTVDDRWSINASCNNAMYRFSRNDERSLVCRSCRSRACVIWPNEGNSVTAWVAGADWGLNVSATASNLRMTIPWLPYPTSSARARRQWRRQQRRRRPTSPLGPPPQPPPSPPPLSVTSPFARELPPVIRDSLSLSPEGTLSISHFRGHTYTSTFCDVLKLETSVAKSRVRFET